MDVKTRRNLWRAVHAAVLLVIAWLAWRFIDFRQVWQLLSSAALLPVAVIVLLATVDRLLMAVKWRQLLRAVDVDASLPMVISTYYQASVVSYIPLMVVGSDVLRGFLVVRRYGRAESVLATMFLEKVLGVLSSCVIGVLGLTIVLGGVGREHGATLAVLAIGTLVVSLALFGLTLLGAVHRLVIRLARWLLPAKWSGRVASGYDAYLSFRRRPALLAGNVALTVTEHIVQMLMLFFAGRALGVTMPLLLFLAAIGLVLMVRRVAIYLEGWGFAETISVVLFGVVGLDPSTALSISLLANGLSMLAVLPGLILLLRGPLGFAALRGRSEVLLSDVAPEER